MANTVNRGWPLPSEARTVKEEIQHLQQVLLPFMDNDVQALFELISGAALAGHEHAIAGITGLVDALAGKMAASTTFALSDLTDVVGSDEAPDGYILVKVGTDYVAQAALSALGAHGHTMAQISGLAAQFSAVDGAISGLSAENAQRIVDITALLTGWATQPIGVPIPVFDNLAGLSVPPNDQAFRYIKLTASDAYNIGALTGEVVSGSAPLVIATAVIDDAESPLDGVAVSLINTERRFLRAGSSGEVQTDQVGHHRHGLSNSGGGNQASGSAIGFGFQNQGYSTSAFTDYFGSAGQENRVKNIGATYYMRIR